jgi:thioredoxin 1
MKTLLNALFTGILLFSSAAFAAGQPITATELADIEKQGKSAVISTHADWCSTCKKQDIVFVEFHERPRLQKRRVLSG